jgi:excisionase family DNA binding protein
MRAQQEVVSELLTVAEAADYLRMSRHWLYRRIAEGQFPHIRVGRAVRFRAVDLDRWLSSQKVGEVA